MFQKTACFNIETSLKKITQYDKTYHSFTGRDGVLRYWLVEVNDIQIRDIQDIEAVHSMPYGSKCYEKC